MKCRDIFEPESVQKCRGSCDVASGSANNSDSRLHFEPEINNEILNLLLQANQKDVNYKRADYYVEDKLKVDDIKVVQMENVTVDSNDIELSDEGFRVGGTGGVAVVKKMSFHVGEDAVNLLSKIQAGGDEEDEGKVVDVAKIKPTFKWKIGSWTRVICIICLTFTF